LSTEGSVKSSGFLNLFQDREKLISFGCYDSSVLLGNIGVQGGFSTC